MGKETPSSINGELTRAFAGLGELLQSAELQVLTLHLSQGEFEGFLKLLGFNPQGHVSFCWRFGSIAFLAVNIDKVPEHLQPFVEIHERAERNMEWRGISEEVSEELAIRAEYGAAKKSDLLPQMHRFATGILESKIALTGDSGMVLNDQKRLEMRQRVFAELQGVS